MYISKEEAKAALPHIEDPALFKAIDFCLWLYLDKHWGLQKAIKKAADKHEISPRSKIEKLFRQVVPEEVILGRQNVPKGATGKPFVDRDREAKRHMRDI